MPKTTLPEHQELLRRLEDCLQRIDEAIAKRDAALDILSRPIQEGPETPTQRWLTDRSCHLIDAASWAQIHVSLCEEAYVLENRVAVGVDLSADADITVLRNLG